MTTAAFNPSTPVLPSAVRAGLHVPAVFVGRCSTCRARHRVAGIVAGHWPGASTWVRVDGVERTLPAAPRLAWRVTCCGATVWCWQIEARMVEGHACGAACRRARGCSCDCSCGGEHHGADA